MVSDDDFGGNFVGPDIPEIPEEMIGTLYALAEWYPTGRPWESMYDYHAFCHR